MERSPHNHRRLRIVGSQTPPREPDPATNTIWRPHREPAATAGARSGHQPDLASTRTTAGAGHPSHARQPASLHPTSMRGPTTAAGTPSATPGAPYTELPKQPRRPPTTKGLGAAKHAAPSRAERRAGRNPAVQGRGREECVAGPRPPRRSPAAANHLPGFAPVVSLGGGRGRGGGRRGTTAALGFVCVALGSDADTRGVFFFQT